MYYELVITIAKQHVLLTFHLFLYSIHCQLEFIARPSLFCLFILHYRTLDFIHAYLFYDFVCNQNCFKNILKTFTACLNKVYRVLSTILKFFTDFAFSRLSADRQFINSAVKSLTFLYDVIFQILYFSIVLAHILPML